MINTSVYESFFINSLSALFLLKTDGTILRANQAACDMLGYTEAELQLLKTDALIEASQVAVSELRAERLAKGRAKGIIMAVRKNGEKFPIKLSTATIQTETGGSMTSVIATDLSEQYDQHENLKILLEETQKLHQKEEDSRILLENVLDSVTDGFFIVDREWKILFWNKAAENILRKSEAELIGKNIWEEFPDLAILKENADFAKLYEKNQSVRFREYFPKYKIWADVSAYPSEKNISVYFKDVTEVKNLRTMERLEREVLEMNARPDSVLEDTLDFYLKEIQEIHKGMLCSVLRLKGNRLYNWSAPGLSENYLNSIEGVEIGDQVGSCGTAAFRKEKVVVTDIENDPLWADYKAVATAEGVKACWSFPLIDSVNQVMGTFAIYYKRVKAPTREEENTLERAKNLLMIILENKMSVEAVKSSIQNYDMVAKATNDAIWDWNVETNEVTRTGKGLEVLFGYKPEEAAEEENFWNKRIHPDDLHGFLQMQSAIMHNPSELYWEDEYRFMRKDGTYAYVLTKDISSVMAWVKPCV
jgi:PAS domain S-box-containing protein